MTATAGPSSSSSGSEPPPARPAAGTTAHAARRGRAGGDPGAQPLGARVELGARGGEHVQHGNVARGARRVAVQAQRGLERGERELVDPHGAGERVRAHPPDRGLGAGDDAGLRPAQQLVRREADEVGARRDALARGRLVARARSSSASPRRASDAGPEVVDQQHVARPRELRERRAARPPR